MNRPVSKRPKLYIVNLQVHFTCVFLPGQLEFQTRRLWFAVAAQWVIVSTTSVFQWTPKDDLATLKIHGKCDDVMRLLMEELNMQIPIYDKWGTHELIKHMYTNANFVIKK